MYDCLINGEIAQDVPVDDRGLAYGHGVFETIAVEQGRAVFLEQHLQRLNTGCKRLALESQEFPVLKREIQTVCAGQPKAVVKVILTGGSGRRGYRKPGISGSRRIVMAHRWPEGVERYRRSGIRTRFCNLRFSHNRALAKIKHLNRLEQVLSARELTDHSIQEGLMMDQEDFLISGVGSNLFVVSDQRLLTPRLDRCGVCGVVRDVLLAGFQSLAEKRRITLDMLWDADEVFITNSIRGIWPVVKIQDQDFQIGPITRKLQDWLGQQSSLLARS